MVIAISGKAESGKTYTANIIKNMIGGEIIPLASTLKEQARALGWNGEKDEKGRSFLQALGKCVKAYNGSDYYAKKLIERMDKDKTYIIDDLRLIEEIDTLKEAFTDIVTIRVTRLNHKNKLTEEQRNDISETGLDDYKFDINLTNDTANKDYEDAVFEAVLVAKMLCDIKEI